VSSEQGEAAGEDRHRHVTVVQLQCAEDAPGFNRRTGEEITDLW
jgi:hypothetical protein